MVKITFSCKKRYFNNSANVILTLIKRLRAIWA